MVDERENPTDAKTLPKSDLELCKTGDILFDCICIYNFAFFHLHQKELF